MGDGDRRHPAPRPSARDVGAFLSTRVGAVDALRPLAGGFWSSAYAFSHAGRALVVRFGPRRDWYEADRAATAFASPALPVPAVLEVGDAFGGAFALSAFCDGTPLEDVGPAEAPVAGPMLASLLGALFEVGTDPGLPVGWHWPEPRHDLTWRGWLRARLVDDPGHDVHGWRAALGTAHERLYRAGEARVVDLLERCPERRDLVHGDLLHANVLVTDGARRPTAVVSWKCSVRGDFLYDTAWCTFCSIWHPGIAAVDPFELIQRVPSVRDDPAALVDAALRHHCYELHIGLTALAWNTWVGDARIVEQVATHLSHLLARGPRAAS